MSGILAAYAMSSTGLLLTPGMQALAEEFADVPYGIVSMLTTIPNLLSMIISFLLATKIEEKINHRIVLLVSLALFTLGGIGPFFVHDFTMTMICRIIFGFGYGTIMNQANAVTVRLYKGRTVDRILALGSMAMNGMCMLSIVVGGIVSDIDIRLIWLIYGVGIIPFILVLLFVPEPPHEEKKKKQTRGNLNVRIAKQGEAVNKIPAFVFLVSICYGLGYMVAKTVMVVLSSIMIEEGIGTAAVAGILLALNRAGGLAGGIIYPYVHKLCKSYTLATAMLAEVIMVVICWKSSSVILFGIAIGMMGVVQFVMHLTISASFAHNMPKIADRCISLMQALINLGGFLPSIFLTVMALITGGNNFRFYIFVLLIISIITTLILAGRGYYLKRDKSHRFFARHEKHHKAVR